MVWCQILRDKDESAGWWQYTIPVTAWGARPSLGTRKCGDSRYNIFIPLGDSMLTDAAFPRILFEPFSLLQEMILCARVKNKRIKQGSKMGWDKFSWKRKVVFLF